VSDGNPYNLLKLAHVLIGYDGSDLMIKELSKKYKNTSTVIFEHFYKCVNHARKNGSIKKTIVI